MKRLVEVAGGATAALLIAAGCSTGGSDSQPKVSVPDRVAMTFYYEGLVPRAGAVGGMAIRNLVCDYRKSDQDSDWKFSGDVDGADTFVDQEDVAKFDKTVVHGLCAGFLRYSAHPAERADFVHATNELVFDDCRTSEPHPDGTRVVACFVSPDLGVNVQLTARTPIPGDTDGGQDIALTFVGS